MDDAAAGQRGTRAIASAELERFLRAHWGVRPATAAPDLGGSVNLNLLVTDDRSVQVAWVYRPVVTGQRVAVLQAVRRHLASQGVPRAEPIAVAPATRGSDGKEQRVFDRTWTLDAATEALRESYQWSIDGVDFELAVRGDKIVRTPGRAAHPAVTLTASNPALANLVTGRHTVAEATEHGHIKLLGSKTAIQRMFNVIGFPLVRLGF